MIIEDILKELENLVNDHVLGNHKHLTTLNLFGYKNYSKDIGVLDKIEETLKTKNVKYLVLPCRMLDVEDITLNTELNKVDVIVYDEYDRAMDSVKDAIFSQFIKHDNDTRLIILGDMSDAPETFVTRTLKQCL